MVAFAALMLPQTMFALPLTLNSVPEPDVVSLLPSTVVNEPWESSAGVICRSTTWYVSTFFSFPWSARSEASCDTVIAWKAWSSGAKTVMPGFPSRVPFTWALTAAETRWLSCGYAAAASTTLSLTVPVFWERAAQPGPNVPDGPGDASCAWPCDAVPASASGTATRAAAVTCAVRLRMRVNLIATFLPWRREHCRGLDCGILRFRGWDGAAAAPWPRGIVTRPLSEGNQRRPMTASRSIP
ncbi:hypothetical protein GCM10011578_043710 [Streptomyces fuscichromogenes]|uniref:Secreted protein n=1 Tax=Streptomyces fuscichromogenes TaxID=1324013 RepID=A0A917XED7_9ACTN|nr:hypothetical protein GCM10011578_043710 [Streptomyces fuscichromogenes]